MGRCFAAGVAHLAGSRMKIQTWAFVLFLPQYSKTGGVRQTPASCV